MITKPPFATIGSKAFVDFPRLGLKRIPAKVDTGADSSAIWVSQVNEIESGLSFVLFAPGYKAYTGKKIIVRSYKTVIVKNSSGIPESRYKVRLIVRLQNRSIRTWFTLSDRSGMTYPILLGRRFLKNKFLVDVNHPGSIKRNSTSDRKLLILISKPKELNELNNFYQKYFGTKTKVFVRGYKDLVFWVDAEKVIVEDAVSKQDLANFDMVFFKSRQSSNELAIATAQYLQERHIPFVDRELLSGIAYDKLSTYVHLAINGVNVSPTFCGSLIEIKKRFSELKEKFGEAFVVKEINAARGKKNYYITTLEDLDMVIKNSGPNDIYIVQKFIENNGYIRANVFGTTVSPIIYRSPVVNPDRFKKHLNQPAGSANATLVPENHQDIEQIKNLAVKVAELMNRQVAGVDLIKDIKTGEYFVLEVNQGAQLKTGSFPEEKLNALVNFIDNELNQ